MTMVARYFAEEYRARAAHRALLAMGLGQSELTLIEPVGPTWNEMGEARVNEEDLASRAVKAGVLLGDKSAAHADHLRQGRTLLAVRAPFGRALQATDILDSHNPVAVAGPAEGAQNPHVFLSEMAAPLSSLLGLPVLSKTRTRPSRGDFLGLPTLSGNRSYLTGRLSNFGRRTASMGVPLLSSNPAPMSSLFRMPVATRAKSGAGWTRSFGFKMLSARATPLSSFFGVHLISGRTDSRAYSPVEQRAKITGVAAPLSRAIRWKPLAAKPLSFLSRMMPPLTRSDFALLGKPGLIKNGAPLSSATAMPVKSGTSGDKWRNSIGLPMLSSNPAPLSSLFGFPVLSDHPRL